jgi:hypothetical protein
VGVTVPGAVLVLLLTVLRPILVAVSSSRAVRVVESAVLLLLVSSETLLRVLPVETALKTIALASLGTGRSSGLGLEAVVGRAGLLSRSTGSSGGWGVHAEEVVQTTSLRLVRLWRGLLLGLLTSALGVSVSASTAKRRLIIVSRRLVW